MEKQPRYQSLWEAPVQELPPPRGEEESTQLLDSQVLPDEEPTYKLDSPIRYFKHGFFRTVFTLKVCVLSFAFPNLNVVLTIGGAVLGTIVSVILPVMFYNRAYSHPELDRANRAYSDREQDAEGTALLKDGEQDKRPIPAPVDSRQTVKYVNYAVLALGSAIGTLGFFNSIRDLLEHGKLSQHDN